MLTPAGCLERQKRFRAALARERIDAAVVTDCRDIYYFTGKLFDSHFHPPACLFLHTAGGGWVLGPDSGGDEGVYGVDECLAYKVFTNATMNPDWMDRLVALAKPKLAAAGGLSRIGWQAQTTPGMLSLAVSECIRAGELTPIDAIMARLQRRKDADEVEVIRRAIACDLAAYTAVQRFIRPGVTELEVLSEGRRAAQDAAGEKVTHDGDYQCNSIGGPARNRPLQAGEVYVIDAWTYYRGYWSDLCRTYSVDNRPTEEQVSVFEHVAAAHRVVTPLFKPGARGTEIARATDEWLRRHPLLKDVGMPHHAGHGTGIRVHMDPDLNPQREGILEEGDLVCFEPGGYAPDERVFVRLENTYQITRAGAVSLVEYPFNLVRKVG